METYESPMLPGFENDDALVASGDANVDGMAGRGRRRRARDAHSETLRPRLTPAERHEVDAAATSTGLSASRFCTEAALAAARGTPLALSALKDRQALALLQQQLVAATRAVNRFGVNVNQAVAALNSTGVAPEWMGRAMTRICYSLAQLDEVVARVDRRLR